jgi:HD-like signal output (HDOD) protein
MRREVKPIELEQRIRERVGNLAYLPTSAAVAMRFIELGKDPDAEPADYVTVASSDSSIASKLLALANSSWFGVRNRVTRIQVAVNLLGLETVRTMAISYCLTGLHNELKLTLEESRAFWVASLCKGVAAKQFALRTNPGVSEEAFAAGLFQDFALPVMFATAREAVRTLIGDESLNAPARLLRERELFDLDHAELGRDVAQKLELPDLFVDAVGFHHDQESLRAVLDRPEFASAVHVAALFPHHLESWNRDDATALSAFLQSQASPIDPQAFLSDVQDEFNRLYGYFDNGPKLEAKLGEMLAAATRENAETTQRLVGAVHQLMRHAAATGAPIHQFLEPPPTR